jgi:hypothetical protein
MRWQVDLKHSTNGTLQFREGYLLSKASSSRSLLGQASYRIPIHIYLCFFVDCFIIVPNDEGGNFY